MEEIHSVVYILQLPLVILLLDPSGVIVFITAPNPSTL